MAKVSDVLDVNEQPAEPQTDLPEHAADTGSSQDIFDATMAEAEREATFAELAAKEGELDAGDLRRAAGEYAEGLSDEELLAEYKKAQAGEVGATDGSESDEAPEPLKLPFALYDDKGTKIDVSQLDAGTVKVLRDLVGGKYQIGYNAMGKEQRKALNDVLRVAANGHLNESKIATSIAERNQVAQELRELKKVHDEWANDRKIWDRVLAAANAGNIEPLKVLLQKYGQEVGRMPEAATPATDDGQLDQAGQHYFVTKIVPETTRIASQYGADPSEVAQAVLQMIQDEGQFLTQEKLDNILKYEIQSVLEQNGYTAGEALAPKTTENPLESKIAQLEQRIQELTAGQANAKTAALRTKSKVVPAAGGGSTPTAGDSVPAGATKSREGMKRWMRGELE